VLTKEEKELQKLARDQARYALKLNAAKSLQPGFKTPSGATTWDGQSTSWEPKEAAPGLQHLLHAGQGRAKPLPKQAASQNWSKEKVIKWLLETPYLKEGEEAEVEAAPPLPNDRWSARVHTIRLMHVCVELKMQFLQKDVPMCTRNEKDAGDRNSFWVLAAEKFNDQSFKPTMLDYNTIKELPAQVCSSMQHV